MDDVYDAFVAGWQAHRFAPHMALETVWDIHKRAAIAAAARQSGDAQQAPGEAPQSGHDSGIAQKPTP